jgi:DNA polymerase III delta prime subunit
MTTDNRLFVYKYQPLYFDDFGKSNDVVKTLRSLLMIDYVNILLVGDIASGKTSILNSIIREYYYGYTPKEYDDNVLYINNLKEQGINYYRTDVKTFCQTCSVIKNKKKIIVLDDIDLINEQSQQVFRNCIDKYGHNVHFISSCSNIQKVIETLQSRLTIIKMLQLHREDLTNILNRIKKAEQIDIDDDAREFVINVSNNTIKILITYMEKFKLLNEKITMDLAVKLCSNISFCVFTNYINLCLENSLPKAIQLIYEIYDKGYSVMDILDNLFFFVKTTTMLNEDQKYTIIPYICKYITIFHNIHEDEIELALFTNNIINMLQ